MIERNATNSSKCTDKNSGKQQVTEYLGRIKHRFHDDRIFLFEVANVSTWSYPYENENESKGWSVIRRLNCGNRNINGVEKCESYNQAVLRIKEIAPTTPLLSLQGKCPDPIPTWTEFQTWLQENGLPKMDY